MKRPIPFFIGLLLGAVGASAQDAAKLTVPGTPAFSILNFEPSAVMRPATAKSLAADVLNAFDEEGKLRMNLGLEVAPYWLKSRPTLKQDDYLRPKAGQAFLQSLSVSAATVRDSVTKQNKFGGGLRFRLLNGSPVPALETARAELTVRLTMVSTINARKSVIQSGDTKQSVVKAIVEDLKGLEDPKIPGAVIDSFQKQANALMPKFKTDSRKDIEAFLDKLIAEREKAYKGMAQNVSRLLYQRQGMILEFATAAGYATRRTTDLDRIGAWGNLSYNSASGDLFTFTARYMHTNNDSSLNNLDAGIGFLKTTPQFNVSAEVLVRHYRAEINDRNLLGQPIKRVEKEFTYRAAFQASYLISKDISINLSIGKDFNSPFLSGSGFFSVAGLNFSIFHKEPLPPVAEQ